MASGLQLVAPHLRTPPTPGKVADESSPRSLTIRPGQKTRVVNKKWVTRNLRQPTETLIQQRWTKDPSDPSEVGYSRLDIPGEAGFYLISQSVVDKHRPGRKLSGTFSRLRVALFVGHTGQRLPLAAKEFSKTDAAAQQLRRDRARDGSEQKATKIHRETIVERSSDDAIISESRWAGMDLVRVANAPLGNTKRESVFMMMPLRAGGDLESVFFGNYPQPQRQAVVSNVSIGDRVAKQILEQLQPLHAQGLAHRDLKPCNLLLTQEDAETEGLGRCVLGDLGTVSLCMSGNAARDAALVRSNPHAKFAGVKGTRNVGTPWYTSPEMLLGEGYTHRTDIWSVAIVLLNAYSGIKRCSCEPEGPGKVNVAKWMRNFHCFWTDMIFNGKSPAECGVETVRVLSTPAENSSDTTVLGFPIDHWLARSIIATAQLGDQSARLNVIACHMLAPDNEQSPSGYQRLEATQVADLMASLADPDDAAAPLHCYTPFATYLRALIRAADDEAELSPGMVCDDGEERRDSDASVARTEATPAPPRSATASVARR